MTLRTVVSNPFSPGSDDVPAIWAGRREALTDFEAELRPRRLAGRYERGRLFLGEPGVGKSVLARRLARQAEMRGDWATGQIRLPRGVEPFQLVARGLLDVARRHAPDLHRDRRLRDLFARVESLALTGIGAVGLRAPDGGPAHIEIFDLLVVLCEAAEREGALLLVHLDEVQNVDADLHASALLTALGDALAHQRVVTTPGGGQQEVHLPIAVYLTGLPEFGDTATARAGATFTRRFKTSLLGPIDEAELREALEPLVAGWEVPSGDGEMGHVVLDADAADALVAAAYRDPFLFQLVGHAAWNAGDEPRITASDVAAAVDVTRDETVLHVDRLLGRLSDLQLAFLRAMVALPAEDRTLSRIVEGVPGKERPEQLGSTTQVLSSGKGIIERGRPYRLLVPALEARLVGPLSDDEAQEDIS